MAIFGFDRPSELPDAAREPELATERWLQQHGELLSPTMPAGPRRLRPACRRQNGATLRYEASCRGCIAKQEARCTAAYLHPAPLQAAAFLNQPAECSGRTDLVIDVGKADLAEVAAARDPFRSRSPRRRKHPRSLGEVLVRGAEYSSAFALEAAGDAG
jgi:hypothetical protein